MTVTPNPTIWHDRLPGMGAWLNDFGQPYQGSVVLEFDARLNRSDGLAIHPAARKYEYQIGDPAQQPQELRDHFEAYWRAFYETAGWIPYPTVPFTPEAWAAFWTRYCQAAIFFRFPANDDPDVIQHGWKMHVIEKLTGAKSEDYWVDVPLKLLDSPIGGININSTLAVPNSSGKADLAIDTPGGLVTIGRDGKINPAWLPEGSGTAAWDGLAGKPRYIAAGATPASAREAIGAAPATAVLTPDQQAMLEDLDRALASKLDKTALTAATDAAPGVVVLASDDDVAAGTPGKVLTTDQISLLPVGKGNTETVYFDGAWPARPTTPDVAVLAMDRTGTAARPDWLTVKDAFLSSGAEALLGWDIFWGIVESANPLTVRNSANPAGTGVMPAVCPVVLFPGQPVLCFAGTAVNGAERVVYAISGDEVTPTQQTMMAPTSASPWWSDSKIQATENRGRIYLDGVAFRNNATPAFEALNNTFVGTLPTAFRPHPMYYRGPDTHAAFSGLTIIQGGVVVGTGQITVRTNGNVLLKSNVGGDYVQVSVNYASRSQTTVSPMAVQQAFAGTYFKEWMDGGQ